MAKGMAPHALAIAILLCGAHAVGAVKLKIRTEPSVASECLTYQMDMYSSFYGSFVALPDIYGVTASYSLLIHAPSGTKVHDSIGAMEGKFNLVPYETGRYKFCLTMVPSHALSRYVLMRDVNWDLHIANADTHHGTVKEHETQGLWTNVGQIDQQIQQLKAAQQWMYWREKRHRQTVDSTNNRVFWYALVRNVTLVSISIAQVLFIRRMFSK